MQKGFKNHKSNEFKCFSRKLPNKNKVVSQTQPESAVPQILQILSPFANFTLGIVVKQ